MFHLVSQAPEYAIFTQGEDHGPLTVSPEVWHDMGKPDTITVTIEPGDHLNHKGDDPTS